MRLRTTGYLLACFALFGATGKTTAEESNRSAWYVDAGAGMNWTSTMKQEGWNRDMICYPDDDCRNVGGTPEGYRWFYDLNSDAGSAFDVSIGRTFSSFRVEFSAAQRKNAVEQAFTAITFLDGSEILHKNSNYQSSATTSVDDIASRSLSLNAYHELPFPRNRISAYLGVGLGVTFIELSGLFFEARYSCKDSRTDCERPEQYDSFQDVDLSDSVLSKHLYAGVDYPLDDRLLVGLKLSYSLMDELLDTSSYAVHPVPDLTNETEIKDMNHWSLTLRLRYRLAN